MFGMLPVLHENQTIYSWCGLAHALNGGTCSRTTSVRLFGAPYAALSHDFPSRLAALESSTGGGLGCSRDIALRNTLLGYYLAIARSPQAEQIIELLRTGTIQHLKMLLGITASRVGGHHPLKGCEKCVADDEESRGWAYWHVEHQLPSVFVCAKHKIPLFIAWDPITPVHRRHWLLPRSSHLYERNEIQIPSSSAMDSLLRLANDSEQLMKLAPAALAPDQLTRGYQRILKESGFATTNGTLRISRLVSLIKDRYRGFEDLPGLAPLKAIDDHWPGLAASLSRRASRPGHPLKHLLLVGAITESWNQFIDACRPQMDAPEVALPTITHEGTTAARLKTFKELVTVHGKSLAAASHTIGISKTTGTLWAKKLNIAYVSRGRPIAAETEARIRRQLKKGDSISDIATATGVSMTTVYRIAGSDPSISKRRKAVTFASQQAIARRNFAKACRTKPDLPLSEIRACPGNSYMWLYRNDHQWLANKLAEQGRISSRSR